MQTEISTIVEGSPSIVLRTPLGSQTNSTSLRSSTSETKCIRRKASFVRKIDSSEEYPSPHESLFDAEYLSHPPTASEDSQEKAAPWQTQPVNSLHNTVHLDHSDKQDENSVKIESYLSPAGITPIIYGRGTHLTTIMEQRSTHSMRTSTSSISRSYSASDPASSYISLKLINDCGSFDLPTQEKLRSSRRLSFSTNDVDLLKQSYHEACTSIERETRKSVEVGRTYIRPCKPILPPHDRPDTPPGLPSWTALQMLPLNSLSQSRWSSRTKARVRRLLRINPEDDELSTQIPIRLRARRFRVPRSSHGLGPIQTHPFLRDISLTTKGVGVDPSPDPDHLTLIPPSSNRSRFQGPRQILGLRRPGQTIVSSPLRSVLYHQTTEDDVSYHVLYQQTHCPHRRATYESHGPPDDACVDPTVAPVNNTFPSTDATPLNSEFTSRHGRTPFLTPRKSSRPLSPRDSHLLVRGAQSSCWRCRIQHQLKQIDHYWEVSTRWCCWWCCGVDIDDVQDSIEGPHVVDVSPAAGSVRSVSLPVSKVRTIRRRSAGTASPLEIVV